MKIRNATKTGKLCPIKEGFGLGLIFSYERKLYGVSILILNRIFNIGFRLRGRR